ncbi:hypothetical protein N0V93_010354 [Gnomoniopsis smithogilvyi]|uniref:Uncharacterized protein n=1 Tax=Gnomoniopsis smithogilvyi TaxID=1191159 RepID=A0A9W9CST2_9PEZI|nr:hypothetical protein N0V93_010354 [Gnomoniopsis smithogilvyi]
MRTKNPATSGGWPLAGVQPDDSDKFLASSGNNASLHLEEIDSNGNAIMAFGDVEIESGAGLKCRKDDLDSDASLEFEVGDLDIESDGSDGAINLA